MLNRPHVPGIDSNVCWSEYARVVPFLQEAKMKEPVHVNVGTIGHVDHSRSAVSACVGGALGTLPTANPFEFRPLHSQPLVLIHASEMDNLLSMLENGMSLHVEVHHPVE
ncbi:hypothetical protein G173_gp115 [Erwinia phage phiEaH2]|uniref:Elongation factor Tu n=1 Tax=Erwinia phage phiEaH2 TaxID=1029988 RepID=J7KKK7_9CAUD|nr:hypothetical protein G173_gp115 [Erwinia phage phiEaH2]AFQ96660.1 hypothetical protein [Erwinia phage phiEaH2]